MKKCVFHFVQMLILAKLIPQCDNMQYDINIYIYIYILGGGGARVSGIKGWRGGNVYTRRSRRSQHPSLHGEVAICSPIYILLAIYNTSVRRFVL
jgi:hypothetical protein